ncbi:hypothetical protein Bbelb_041630 [Branchiostoma belcheri]|nr:hypothetical protein Bbelb_041630 [Branchiostoma belcheri]
MGVGRGEADFYDLFTPQKKSGGDYLALMSDNFTDAESLSPACLNYRYGGVEPEGSWLALELGVGPASQPPPGLDSPVAVIYTSGRRAFAARTASLDSRDSTIRTPVGRSGGCYVT